MNASVLGAVGSHPFPSRTRKLSPPAPKILGTSVPGKIGQGRDLKRLRARKRKRSFLFFRRVRSTVRRVEFRDLRPWRINPLTLRRTEHGLNNESYFVDAAEGQFVARVYRNTADPSRVRDEHDLLARIAPRSSRSKFPSRRRPPTATRSRCSRRRTVRASRRSSSGSRVSRRPSSVANARVAGRALAQLDRALGQLDLPVRSPCDDPRCPSACSRPVRGDRRAWSRRPRRTSACSL